MNIPLIDKKKPVFGIDVGHSSIKIVQLEQNHSGKLQVLGYGFNSFSPQAIKDGAVKDTSEVAKSIYALLTEMIIGGINTNRVAAAIPVAQTFTRILVLPSMSADELDEAVRLEVEQYVPMQLEELYVDYEVTYEWEDKKNGKQVEVLMVAAPKHIVNSYVDLFTSMDLEVGMLETSLLSSVRGVNATQRQALKGNEEEDDGATLLIDLGAKSSDLSIFDHTIRVTGTIQNGGDTVTKAIAKALKLTERQAYTIKTRYGLDEGKHQKAIQDALQPALKDLIKEIRKMQRYYKSRAVGTGDISRLTILGGGANLPGLSTYLANETGLTVSICNPWQNIDFGQLQEPHKLETTMYTTAVGLALSSQEKLL